VNESTTDVLVVGAGPTGLLAASELARLGVHCRIIDRAPHRSPYSRALAIHARTLEMLDLLGVAPELVERGNRVPGMGLRSDGGPSAFLDMSPLATHFPYVLILPQGETEEVLEARLASMGVGVERGVEWLDFAEQHGWVTSRVRTPDGETSLIHARYLIGCDGGHSAVRHALGLPFTGASDDIVAFLADVEADGAVDRGRLHLFSSRRGLAVLVPFKEGALRVIAIDFTKQRSVAADPLTLDELQETVDAIVPMNLALREPRWITRFGAQHRLVRRYRSGRVFLAGDAAHVHNPAGGQGMNTGLQDACNLAWKLAFVLTGRAPHALLQSYHAERRPVGAHVLRLTERMLRALLVRGRVRRAARNLMTRITLSFPPVRHALRDAIAGLDIDYRFTDRSKRDRARGLPAHALQAGEHVPDVRLEDAQRRPVRLYDLLHAPRYTLFMSISLRRLVRDRRSLAELVRGVDAWCGDAIQSFVVLDVGVPDALGLEAPALIDVTRDFADRLGAGDASVMLIRPDGYVAFHHRGFDLDTVVGARRSGVGPPPRRGGLGAAGGE
jgi:2-polyprenyl-6-methoxyphenol hydroxylase-like FAD-dependent oxidoreductase